GRTGDCIPASPRAAPARWGWTRSTPTRRWPVRRSPPGGSTAATCEAGSRRARAMRTRAIAATCSASAATRARAGRWCWPRTRPAAAAPDRLAGRPGAGLVSVATRPQHVPALLARRPEAMAHAVEDSAALEPLLARADVVALGPGLGQDTWGAALHVQALAACRPLVLDADALNLLAR